jgi:hypothetical protein
MGPGAPQGRAHQAHTQNSDQGYVGCSAGSTCGQRRPCTTHTLSLQQGTMQPEGESHSTREAKPEEAASTCVRVPETDAAKCRAEKLSPWHGGGLRQYLSVHGGGLRQYLSVHGGGLRQYLSVRT